MKKIILILIFISSVLFGQVKRAGYQSTYTGSEVDSAIGFHIGNSYFASVGSADSDYPLTVNGLKNAISSLSGGGTVYVKYPGIPDTTGLGSIPDSINIRGYLLGRYLNLNQPFINQVSPNSLRSKYGWSGFWESNFHVGTLESPIPLHYYLNTFGDQVWQVVQSGTAFAMGAQLEYKSSLYSVPANGTAFRCLSWIELSGTGQLASNSIIKSLEFSIVPYNTNGSYSNLTSMITSNAHIDLGDENVSTNTGSYGYKFYVGSGGTGTLSGNIYSFYSDLTSSRINSGATRYHLYTVGDYPSLFAGDIIIANSKTPASASATGTAGTIAWDSNYIYICTATNTWKRVAISTW